MKENKNLVLLKEAAKISGYSSDYIGQLIRAGKIPGKQVYCNVAWMTTVEAVLKYKQNSEKNKGKEKKNSLKDYFKSRKQKILMELSIIKLFFQTFRSALPIFLIVIVSFLLLVAFIFYYQFSSKTQNINQKQNEQILLY